MPLTARTEPRLLPFAELPESATYPRPRMRSTRLAVHGRRSPPLIPSPRSCETLAAGYKKPKPAASLTYSLQSAPTPPLPSSVALLPSSV